MSRGPNFDELIGDDVPNEERERLRHAHELLIQAGPPPELSPDLESVPWPEDSLSPLLGRRRPARRRPLLLAAGLATAAVIGFVFGQATSSTSTSIDTQRTLKLRGTALARNAQGTLELGKVDEQGNLPMVLYVNHLKQLPEDGYYDLYLTRHGKPLALCGSFNVNKGQVVVRFTVGYDLEHFDKKGWVVTRQLPGQHEPRDIVLETT